VFRRIVVVVCTVVLATGLVATTASANTIPAGSWAPKFCSTLQSWQQKLNSDGNAAQSALSGNVSDLKGAKAQLVTFLDRSVANTKNAVKSLQKAGAPDTANGTKIAAQLVAGMQSAQKLFASAGSTARTLSTTNLSKFESTAKRITTSLNKGGDAVTASFNGVAKLDPGAQLSTALQAEPACAFLSSGSGPTTTTTG
jgi:hypothetical protein